MGKPPVHRVPAAGDIPKVKPNRVAQLYHIPQYGAIALVYNPGYNADFKLVVSFGDSPPLFEDRRCNDQQW
jgi:hypothetical protein